MTVPSNITAMSTDNNVPVARLDELQAHLTQVQADDSTKIDARLLDEVELQLTGLQSNLAHNMEPHKLTHPQRTIRHRCCRRCCRLL